MYKCSTFNVEKRGGEGVEYINSNVTFNTSEKLKLASIESITIPNLEYLNNIGNKVKVVSSSIIFCVSNLLHQRQFALKEKK